MSSTLLLPPRAQLCNRSCSNKTHTFQSDTLSQTLRVFGELMRNISATRGRPDMRFCVCGIPRGDLSHIAGLTLGRSRSDFSGANRRTQDHMWGVDFITRMAPSLRAREFGARSTLFHGEVKSRDRRFQREREGSARELSCCGGDSLVQTATKRLRQGMS